MCFIVTFDKFMDFLSQYNNDFNLTTNDINLMKYVFKGNFSPDLIKEDISNIDEC